MATSTKMKKVLINGIRVDEGSENVFADLGYANPGEALARAQIAQHISELIEQRGLTQAQAAALLKIDQPKISKITKGQVRDFSTERLLRFVSALGDEIELVMTSSTGKANKKKIFRLKLFPKQVKLHGTKAA